MIDIDKIESQCNAAIQNGYGHLPVIECGNAAKVSELIGLLRQAEKDAARYRWLRDTAHTVTGLTPCAFVMMDGELMEDCNGQYGLLCLGVLDAAVDEAKSVNQA